MEALIVAAAAVYMGAFGPRFLWRGALAMVVIVIVVGLASTLVAYQESVASGPDYRITPASVAVAFVQQLLFASVFYALAAVARWCHRGLTGARSAAVPPAEL